MKSKNLNKEEFIKNYQQLKSSRKMAELYNCNRNTITAFAKKIGYDYSNNKEIKITAVPPEQIIQLYNEVKNCQVIANQYNCSGTSVRNYLISLGVELKNINNKLTMSKEQFIKDYDELKTAKAMAQKYNCSEVAIRNYAHKINYNFNKNNNYKLSEADKQYIIDNYNCLTSNELSKELNVSRGMITKVWYDHGLSGKVVSNPKTTEVDLSNKTFGRWKVLYKTNKRTASGGIKWHCQCECGVERDVSSLSLINGTSTSCGAHYNNSRGNTKIKELLMQNNIPFELEKKFKTCKDKNYLPFDFYVNNSYLIEYDGIQHYDENTIFDYEYTHKHDLIKSEWCKNNNITLIRIPYTHYDNLTIDDLIPETSNFIENYADFKSRN